MWKLHLISHCPFPLIKSQTSVSLHFKQPKLPTSVMTSVCTLLNVNFFNSLLLIRCSHIAKHTGSCKLLHCREKDKLHVEWVQNWNNVFKELQEYVKKYHTTGLSWNTRGGNAMGNLKAAPPNCGVPPPPPRMLLDVIFIQVLLM